jgi:hypothetical protein
MLNVAFGSRLCENAIFKPFVILTQQVSDTLGKV